MCIDLQWSRPFLLIVRPGTANLMTHRPYCLHIEFLLATYHAFSKNYYYLFYKYAFVCDS